MSSVLHPVGPEPTQTYWVRRVMVLGGAILLLSLVIAVIVNGNSTGSAVQPTPPSVPAAAAATPTLSPSARSASPSAASPSAAATPRASQQATARPSSEATASSSAKPTTKPTAKGPATQTAKATPKPSASPTADQPPPLCNPAETRVTLTGKQLLKRKKAITFSLSMINGSGRTCVVSANAENFELKIYSGTDRIWSTGDCSKSVPSIDKKLAAEQAVDWKMTWNGRRSAKGCKVRPEIPRAGTYFATAQLEDAKPVQLRMIIHN